MAAFRGTHPASRFGVGSGDGAKRTADDVASAAAQPTSSGTRSVGTRLRATLASYRCASALAQRDLEAARLEYWVLQQALDDLGAGAGEIPDDEALVALQSRGRDLGRMLAMGVTPSEFKRRHG